MKLHERHEPVVKARIDIMEAVTNAISKYRLTYPELFHVLVGVMQDWTKNAVKDERYPG